MSETSDLTQPTRYFTFWSMEPPYKDGRLRYHLGQAAMLELMEALATSGCEVSAVVCDPPVILNSRSRPESDSQRATIERFLRTTGSETMAVLRMSDLCRDARRADPGRFEHIEDAVVSHFKLFHVAASELHLSEQARRDLSAYRAPVAGEPPVSLAGPLAELGRRFAGDAEDLLQLLYAFVNRPTWFESHNLAATAAMLSHLVVSAPQISTVILEAERNAYSWLTLRALAHHPDQRDRLLTEFPQLRLTRSVPSIAGGVSMRLAEADSCLFIDSPQLDVAARLRSASPVALTNVAARLGEYSGAPGGDVSIEQVLRKYRERARSAGLLATVEPTSPDGDKEVHLILRGGGAKGVSLVGATDTLWPHYHFRAFWGTSAGAIVAVLLGAGYQPAEVLAVLKETPISSLVGGGRIKRYWNLLRHGVLHADERVRPWLDSVLSAKIDSAGPVRMRDLPFHTTIFAAQTGVGTLRFDSQGENADAPVSFAVRSSIAIPFVFSPTSKDGTNVYDGGLTNNFPLRQFRLSRHGEEPFLGVLVRPDSNSSSLPWWRRRLPVVNDIFDIWTGQDEVATIDQFRDQLVVIDTFPVGTLDLSLSMAEIEFLVSAGRAEAALFLSERGTLTKEEAESAQQIASNLRNEVSKSRKYAGRRARRTE
jgi:predicted acylesterase/phospholipase RssA